MAEYIALKKHNADGVIALSTSTFQTIAKIVIEEDENTSLSEGNSLFKYPLTAKVADDQLVLSIDLKVKYNVNVNDACSKIQGKIFENIEHMTGYTPDVIDIRVSGFMF